MKLGFKFGDHFVHYFVKPFSNNFMTMVLQFVLSLRVHLSAVSIFKEDDEFRRSQNPSLHQTALHRSRTGSQGRTAEIYCYVPLGDYENGGS